ncbi:MAG: helix-turn-helix transcriptional regulator [Hyphomicrobiaceae bacterium]|nr:helix-turn-helix transcriptional regulator [Hyphomicrobiaceae bacterium]
MLITPEQLPIWVPGELTVDSGHDAWDGLRLRGYHYKNLDVPIPPLQDYMIVVYRGGETPMNRRCSGPWRAESVQPGAVSILTQAEESHWHWKVPIEVLHIYITPAKLAHIASDTLNKHVAHVELLDVLRADDPLLRCVAEALFNEANSPGLGEKLFVEAVTNHVCVHILRKYAGDFRFKSVPARGLSREKMNRIDAYIDSRLSENISLSDLAEVAGSSIYYFIRQFQISYGCPPHAHLMKRRLDRAKDMIGRGGVPLKLVAASCGFSDQSHMTRLFKRAFDVTPGVHRRRSCVSD